MRIGKILVYVLIAVLTVGLLVMLLGDHDPEKAKVLTAQEREAQAAPYRAEILEIEMELSRQQKAAKYKPDAISIMIGFLPEQGADVEKIMTWSEGYAFTPVVVLDCEAESAVQEEILTALQGKKTEIALMGDYDTAGLLNMVEDTLGLVQKHGFERPGAFLAIGSEDDVSTFERLGEMGFPMVMRFSDAYEVGVTPGGVPLACYSMMYAEENITWTLGEMGATNSTCLLGTMFRRVREGSLTEGKVLEELRTYDQQVAGGSMRYCTLTEAGESVLHKVQEDQRLYAEHLEYREKKEERIRELQDKIDDLYRGVTP